MRCPNFRNRPRFACILCALQGALLAALVVMVLAASNRPAFADFTDALTANGNAVSRWTLREDDGNISQVTNDEIGPMEGRYIKQGKFRYAGKDGITGAIEDPLNGAIWFENNCNPALPVVAPETPTQITNERPGHVRVPHTPISGATEFDLANGTISFWVKTLGSHGTVISKDHIGYNDGDFEIYIEAGTNAVVVRTEPHGGGCAGPDDDNECILRSDLPTEEEDEEEEDGTVTKVLIEPVTLDDPDYWYNITFAFGGRQQLIIDGMLVVDNPKNFNLQDNIQPLIFGASQRNSPTGFPDDGDPVHTDDLEDPYCGHLDEVVLFDATLKAEEMQTIIAATVPADPQGRHIFFSTNGGNDVLTTATTTIDLKDSNLVDYDPVIPEAYSPLPGQVLGEETGLPFDRKRDLDGIHYRRGEGTWIFTMGKDGEQLTLGPGYPVWPDPSAKIQRHHVVEWNPTSITKTSLWGDPIPPGEGVYLVNDWDWSPIAGQSVGNIGVNLVSVHPDNQTLLISIRNNIYYRVGKSTNELFNREDVIEYNGCRAWRGCAAEKRGNLEAGEAEILFDGSPPTFRRKEDINAFHMKYNGNYILSTRSASTTGDGLVSLGRRYFRKGDLIEYNPDPTKVVDGLGPLGARKILDAHILFNRQPIMDAVYMPPYQEGFNITLGKIGVSCVPEPVTVTARLTDGGVNKIYEGTTRITASPHNGEAGSVMSWTSNGHGTWDPDESDPRTGVYTWSPLDEGEVEFQLNYEAGDAKVVVDVWDEFNPTIRDDNSEGAIKFFPWGFVASHDKPSAAEIEAANGDLKISPLTAGAPHSLWMTAYGKMPGSEECGIIESFDGTKQIQTVMVYNNPGAPEVPKKVEVDTVNGKFSISTTFAPMVLTFDQGQTEITGIKYRDVGRVSILLAHIIDPEIGILWDTAFKEWGDSGLHLGPIGALGHDLVFAPDHFRIDQVGRYDDGTPVPTNMDDADDDWWAHAGEPFQIRVTAMTAGDAAASESPIPASNFGREHRPADPNAAPLGDPITVSLGSLYPSAFKPTGGSSGNIDHGKDELGVILKPTNEDGDPIETLDFDDASPSDGAAGAIITWDEVGILRITAQIDTCDLAGNCEAGKGYLGTGVGVANLRPSDPIGRFSPHHFEVANTTPVTPGCSEGTGFTYSRQPFQVELTIQAKNVFGGTTENYRGDFAKWNPVSVDDTNHPDQLTVVNTGPTLSPFVTPIPFSPAPKYVAGECDPMSLAQEPMVDYVDESGIDHDFDNHNPGEVKLKFTQMWDMEKMGETAARFYLSEIVEEEEDDAHRAPLETAPQIALGNFRVGRLNIPNAYGSELEDLDVPMQVEFMRMYGSSAAWVKDPAGQTCVAAQLNGLVGVTSDEILQSDPDYDGKIRRPYSEDGFEKIVPFLAHGGGPQRVHGDTAKDPALEMVDLNGDQWRFRYDAQGKDNTGTWTETFPVDQFACWLQSDWNENGPENPEFQYTYGIFKGSKKRVFVREVY